ncbi:hypothetical protein L249_3711 [Ophiocordyceps polyrhachis-furcata BCC 54312]|uniref:Uncharacterized protein n=1 Tax=Ophiocordyceps polyrhachis-furcata BCC 54312 TaxID=1330021 RepID=A0A367L4S7_9HYPO|nr:hypothetical protein L249_3711 [Ophiocordyceps polyrhachis-furcata BCC 54312]
MGREDMDSMLVDGCYFPRQVRHIDAATYISMRDFSSLSVFLTATPYTPRLTYLHTLHRDLNIYTIPSLSSGKVPTVGKYHERGPLRPPPSLSPTRTA